VLLSRDRERAVLPLPAAPKLNYLGMRPALITCALLLACATLATTAASTPQEIFNASREQVFDNIRRAPRYTCVENITRAQYRPAYAGKLNSCPAYINAHDHPADAKAGSGTLRWHDRLRLDVAVLNGQETFAWAGARKFESANLDDLVANGTTGTGDFFSFLISVFNSDSDRISYEGAQQTPLGMLTLFNYNVPLNKSRYQYHTDRVDTVLAHHGSIWLDNGSWGLRRLIVESSEPPAGGDLCRVRNTMDYQQVKIGNGDFLLPEVTTMEVVYNDGTESKNETRFSGCHEYGAESTISFDDPDNVAAGAADDHTPLQPLPPATRIQIGLAGKIDTSTAAAGDEIIGLPLREVRDRKLGVLVKTTDRLHGRILRLEQFLTNDPRWILAVRFDTIERNGAEEAISLTPLDDGDRSRKQAPPEAMARGFGRGGFGGGSAAPATPIVVPPPRPPGGAVFMFSERRELVLDRGFHASWETR